MDLEVIGCMICMIDLFQVEFMWVWFVDILSDEIDMCGMWVKDFDFWGLDVLSYFDVNSLCGVMFILFQVQQLVLVIVVGIGIQVKD